MDFDFTFRQLVKIAIFVVITLIVGFIIYFAVKIAPNAISEIVNNAVASSIRLPTR